MDNFFTSIFRYRNQREATPGVPSSTTDGATASGASASGESVGGGSFSANTVYAGSPQSALAVSAVYRATTLIAQTFATMPVQYRKKDFERGNFTPDMRGLGRRLNYLLQQEPNPVMSAASLWQQVSIARIMQGNGFVYVERDEFGFPFRLWLVRSGEYNIMTGRFAAITYLSDHGYVSLADVPREDVLHFPNTFRYDNGVWGIPTLRYAIDSLSTIRTMKQQTLETAAKGGRIKGFIGEEKPASGTGTLAFGLINKGAGDDYARELSQKVYQQDITFLRGLDKWVPLSMTAQDMQMTEQLGMNLDDVARYWGVPRPLLMLDTNSHYNDYQNATMEFHTRTILPLKTEMEKEITRKLIGLKDYGTRDIHICEDPLMAMDPERRAKVAQLKMQSGLCTVNEARAEFDMPSVADGDEPLASANLMTLKALIAKSDAATQLKPGNYTVPAGSASGEEQPKED